MSSPEIEPTQPTTVPRELLFGAIGAAIAIGCLLLPLVHFVAGPFGPAIGAFFAARQVKPATRGTMIIAATIASVIAGLIAAIAFSIVTFSDGGRPSWFPDDATLAAIIGGVWIYAAVLAGVGIAVSHVFDGKQRDASNPT